jgi:hypothetical protein
LTKYVYPETAPLQSEDITLSHALQLIRNIFTAKHNTAIVLSQNMFSDITFLVSSDINLTAALSSKLNEICVIPHDLKRILCVTRNHYEYDHDHMIHMLLRVFITCTYLSGLKHDYEVNPKDNNVLRGTKETPPPDIVRYLLQITENYHYHLPTLREPDMNKDLSNELGDLIYYMKRRRNDMINKFGTYIREKYGDLVVEKKIMAFASSLPQDSSTKPRVMM